MKKIFFFASLLTMVVMMAGCSKDDDNKSNNNEPVVDVNAYLLNEGSWNMNNAELSGFNTADGSIANKYFFAQNNRALGDLAQDMLLYGSKLYVTVSGSGTIEVIDPETGVSTRQIAMGDRYPRYMAADGGKLYVSCYKPHSVVRIDTATLEIEATCELTGYNPESLCICGGNLYVCNGYETGEGGSYIYDSTLSVVDIATFVETEKIRVGINPSTVKATAENQLAVCYIGNYIDAFSGIAIIDVPTHTVSNLPFSVTGMDVYQGDIYTYAYDYMEQQSSFHKISSATLSASPILGGVANSIKTPYALKVNPDNGDIYVTDAGDYTTNGDLYCFGKDGSLKWKSGTGILPSRICFLK